MAIPRAAQWTTKHCNALAALKAELPAQRQPFSAVKPAVAAEHHPHRTHRKQAQRTKDLTRTVHLAWRMNSGNVYSASRRSQWEPWPRRAPPSHLPEGLLVLRAMRTTLLCSFASPHSRARSALSSSPRLRRRRLRRPRPPRRRRPRVRLPSDVRPTAYELELRIDPDADAFGGTVRIALDLQRPRRVLWLHVTSSRSPTRGCPSRAARCSPRAMRR